MTCLAASTQEVWEAQSSFIGNLTGAAFPVHPLKVEVTLKFQSHPTSSVRADPKGAGPLHLPQLLKRTQAQWTLQQVTRKRQPVNLETPGPSDVWLITGCRSMEILPNGIRQEGGWACPVPLASLVCAWPA